jgi:hypothetical protein
MIPVLERLENRLVLAPMLVSTNVAGPSIGQTLSNVVGNTTLGGLGVSSTAGFNTQNPPNYLLLSQKGTDFALVTYVSASPSSFKTLALPAGDGSQVLSGETIVSQAPSGVTVAGPGQPLSKNPFTLKMATQPNTFAPKGYLYVQGSHGNYIIQYKSESDTRNGDTTFSDCTIAGSFGALTGSPFSDVVNAGSFVVQSVSPPSGQSTSINPRPITVTANTPFTLPVISTAGFDPATPADPGFSLVYYQGGVLAVVSYTGISPDPSGGSELTGCTTWTAGTIGAFGSAAPGPPANVRRTSAAPIDFTFTDDAANTPVYFAIAGQQIDTQNNDASTFGYLAPQMTDGKPDFTKPLQFQTFGGNTSVPTYTLFSEASPAGATQSVLIPNNPYTRLGSIRMIFGVGSPPKIPIISGQPSFPAAGNPTDPNNSINYDFVEFTERSSPNDGVLFINTTQVDQVGLPFTMQTTPKDAVKSKGVGITVSRSKLFDDFSSYIEKQFDSITKAKATAKISTNARAGAEAASKAFRSLRTTHRLLNPSDAITNPPDSSVPPVFNTYFDAALTTFFKDYTTSGSTFRLQRDGFYSMVRERARSYEVLGVSSYCVDTSTGSTTARR